MQEWRIRGKWSTNERSNSFGRDEWPDFETELSHDTALYDTKMALNVFGGSINRGRDENTQVQNTLAQFQLFQSKTN